MTQSTRRRDQVAVMLIAASLVLPGRAQTQSSGGTLSNLLGGLFSGSKCDQEPQPQAAPGALSPPVPWRSEYGSSGHPLMTEVAMRQASANFPNYVTPR